MKIDLQELGCALIRRWIFLRVTSLGNFGISGTELSCSDTRDDDNGGDDDDKSEQSGTINWYRKASLGTQSSSPVSYPRVEDHALAHVGYVTGRAFLYMLEERQIPLLLTEIKSGRSVSIP